MKEISSELNSLNEVVSFFPAFRCSSIMMHLCIMGRYIGFSHSRGPIETATSGSGMLPAHWRCLQLASCSSVENFWTLLFANWKVSTVALLVCLFACFGPVSQVLRNNYTVLEYPCTHILALEKMWLHIWVSQKKRSCAFCIHFKTVVSICKYIKFI